MNLIDHERQRMLAVAWLIIVDRTEPSVADAAGCPHGLKSGPVFSTEGPVFIPWVSRHGGYFLHTTVKMINVAQMIAVITIAVIMSLLISVLNDSSPSSSIGIAKPP